MALPVNIEKLIHGQAVEWERLEFKKGWNPEPVMHTICAFANDINNWGGGYIIIGVDAKNGRPVLPPEGLPAESIDSIQGKIVEVCHKIQPNYLPLIQPDVFMGKHIIVIWVTAGDLRPYTALTTLGQKAERAKYIRSGSKTIIARGGNERRLDELTARIPFDDRINQNSSLENLDLGLIQAYLKQIKSELYEESKSIPFADLCRKMNIARGPDEFLRPVNVGLMFFNENPEEFFDRARIEVVIHKDDFGKEFSEKKFIGPLNKQLKDALDYIKNNVLRYEVRKVKYKAEAPNLFNYPFPAIEESLSNAIYHKGYDVASPIEVQVFVDHITILSYPGSLPPVDQEALKKRIVVARDYRNRRIGDFLKDMELTEGRGSGFPIIYSSMEKNGSPAPVFFTDDTHTCFLVTLYIHPAFLSKELPAELKAPANLKDVNKIVDWVFTNHGQDIIGETYSNFTGETGRDIVRDIDLEADNVDYLIDTIDLEPVRDIVGDIAGDIDYRTIEYTQSILTSCLEFKSREAVFKSLGLVKNSKNYNTYMAPLIDLKWLAMLKPEAPTSPKQRYRTTLRGALVLRFIERFIDDSSDSGSGM